MKTKEDVLSYMKLFHEKGDAQGARDMFESIDDDKLVVESWSLMTQTTNVNDFTLFVHATCVNRVLAVFKVRPGAKGIGDVPVVPDFLKNEEVKFKI